MTSTTSTSGKVYLGKGDRRKLRAARGRAWARGNTWRNRFPPWRPAHPRRSPFLWCSRWPAMPRGLSICWPPGQCCWWGFASAGFARLSRLAGIALHLHRKHAAAGIWRRSRMGIAAGLSCHRRIGGRRSALLRDRAFAAVPPLGACRDSHACFGLRRCRLHCLPRREALR